MLRRHELREVRCLIASDVRAALRYAAGFLEGNASAARKLSILLMPGPMCCALHRLAHWMWCKDWRFAAGLLARINYVVHKAEIAPGASIGPGMYLPHTVGVLFQGHAGRGLTLYTNCQVAPQRATPPFGEVPQDAPTLGNDVTVGAYAVVLGPAQIGDAVRIGPAAVINGDLGPEMVAFSRLRPKLSAQMGASS